MFPARRTPKTAPPPGSAGAAAVRPERVFTPAEETANWVIHALGLLLSIPGAALLVLLSLRGGGDAWDTAGCTVFGLTLILLYAASTAYHACRDARKKALLLRLDHAAIFLLIAGTNTPFLLTALRGGPGSWPLLGVIWGLCGTGAVVQLFSGERLRRLSTPLYLMAGWLIVVAFKPLMAALPPESLRLLVAGGLCYTFGVIFHRWHGLRHHHAVWHGFVLAGSVCHFLAVLLLFTQPRPV